MGNFADTLFGVLLGWAKTAVSWLWGVISDDGSGGMMSWVLDHWLLLLILLCLGGMLIDFVVYLIRWQPYRMWRGFQRHTESDEETENEPAEAENAARQWIYADGRTVTEEATPLYAPRTEPEETLSAPVRPVKRVIPARRRRASTNPEELVLPEMGEVGDGYHQPYYPPQWQHVQQDDGGYNE